MYEKEFEEGLSRLSPEIATMIREAHEQAIREEEISNMITKANLCELNRRDKVVKMIDRAVDESKDYGR